MRYQFFICKPLEHWDDLVSRSLRKYLLDGEYKIEDGDCFSPFDVERMIGLLRVASGETAGSSPCFKFRVICGAPLIAVKTEYRKAQEVADRLSQCLGEDGVMLFDGEMDCRIGIHKVERRNFIAARLAHQRHMIAIRGHRFLNCSFRSKASYFKLGECFYCRTGTIDTAVSILNGDFKNAVKQFYDALSQTICGDESLHCQNGCFVVESKDCAYRLRFVMEGPGKCPMYMGWVEDGEVKLEMLRRMGIYQLRRSIDQYEKEYVRSRLYFDEGFATRSDWRNPADRYVDSYKLEKRLKKSGLDVIYGRHPKRRHNEFEFYVCDEHDLGWDAWRTSSFFTMSEEQAAPLLAVFESVVPYYYEYYFDKFHFRKEEADQILKRLREVRLAVLEDPCGEALGKIAERLMQSEFAREYPDSGKAVRFYDAEKRKAEMRKNLSQNRYRIVALFDFFAWWLSEQLHNPNTSSNGFYVFGP